LGGWRSEAGGEDELCEEEEQDVPFVGGYFTDKIP